MWICARCGALDLLLERKAYALGWLRLLGRGLPRDICPKCAVAVLKLLTKGKTRAD